MRRILAGVVLMLMVSGSLFVLAVTPGPPTKRACVDAIIPAPLSAEALERVERQDGDPMWGDPSGPGGPGGSGACVPTFLQIGCGGNTCTGGPCGKGFRAYCMCTGDGGCDCGCSAC